MKTIQFILILILSCQSFANANLNENGEPLSSRLELFEIDTERFSSPVEFAKIKIDEVNGLVQLTIRFQDPCPKDGNTQIQCRALRPENKIISMPLIDKETGSCGEVVFKAQKDHRAVDGPIENIEVIDRSSLVCREVVSENQKTQVNYFFGLEGRHAQISSMSYFWGTQLQK